MRGGQALLDSGLGCVAELGHPVLSVLLFIIITGNVWKASRGLILAECFVKRNVFPLRHELYEGGYVSVLSFLFCS